MCIGRYKGVKEKPPHTQVYETVDSNGETLLRSSLGTPGDHGVGGHLTCDMTLSHEHIVAFIMFLSTSPNFPQNSI